MVTALGGYILLAEITTKPFYEAVRNTNMSDLLDFSHLPEDIREKLAELDLELSEGEFLCLSFCYRGALGRLTRVVLKCTRHITNKLSARVKCCCCMHCLFRVLVDRSIFCIYVLVSTLCGVSAVIVYFVDGGIRCACVKWL